MNKYTTLLQKYLKIIIFGSLVLGLFLGFGQLFHASSTLQENASRDPSAYKADFFKAMQENDLAQGRIAYDKLLSLLPPQDPFLVEIAPAYLADLYLKYAQTLRFDPNAYAMMLAQARELSPQHPLLLVMQAQIPQNPITESIPQTPLEENVITELALLDEVETPIEAPSEPLPEVIQDGPPRIPYIDPPPLSVQFMSLDEEIAVAQAPAASAPGTTDPCALSFYTKENPLTACIDPVANNRYGPALFVVADPHNLQMLAFSQQAVTHQDYDVFCDATGQCYEEVKEPKPLIDLTDVEESVHDYNAYCKMTGSCESITEQPPQAREPLTRGQIQRYALWLSKQTGYKYRQPNDQDSASIKLYFQECVNAKVCKPEILQTLNTILAQRDNILVREVISKN